MDKNQLLKIISLDKQFRKGQELEEEKILEILELAKQHGLEDYAVESLFECFGNGHKAGMSESLKDEQIKKEVVIQCKLKELKKLVTVLNEAGIDFAIIKGFGTVYWMNGAHINSKIYSDYDILVSENQISLAKDVLKKEGYVQSESNEKEAIRKHLVWHISPLKKEPFFCVELHHRFTQIYDKHSFNVSEALKNKVMVEVRGVQFPTLNLENSIYLLALHMYQHEYKDITFQLRHHAEIANIILLHKQEINWGNFVNKIIENKAQFPVSYAFYHINLVYKEILGESCIPEYVLEKIQPEDFLLKKDMLTHRHRFGEEPFGNWDFQTFHWKLKYGSDWKGGYEARLFGDVRYVTLRYYYLFFRYHADEMWKKECEKIGMEYDQELFF